MSEEAQNINDKEMHLVDHLGELRKRIIWSAIIFIGFFVVGFIYMKDIYQYFTADLPFQLKVLGPGDIVWIYLIIASVFALVVTVPFICFQVWLFVRPALTPKERRVTLSYIPAIFLLFIGGLCFGYFGIQPLIFDFIMNLSKDMFDPMFTADKYFSFLLQVTFPFAIFFEVPIIVMFLTSIGIIEPKKLRKTRKYGYFVLVIVGTMISPPDFFLQIVVALPLIFIYEISIVLSSFVHRRKMKSNNEE